MPSDIPFPQVLAATRAEVAKLEPGVYRGFATAYGLLKAVADAAGWTEDPSAVRGYAQNKAWAKFAGQVTRALNKMAEAGELVKAEDRHGPGRGIRWFKPDDWNAEQAEREARNAERVDVMTRKAKVEKRLAAILPGREFRVEATVRGVLAWEDLTDLAEVGSRAITSAVSTAARGGAQG
jgi:hypothetical protein